ncbi:MAG TPA: DMT family transporter [Pseudonocardiaceae bacterium]|nr:DMT family transporter [Pseudonocardiaceae bacterium]
MLSLALAVLAALGNATASVLQRKADRDEPEGQSTGLILLWRLAHRPAWLGGIAALIVAFLLQAAALTTGPIALVQPILVLELVFTLLLASMVFHSRLHAREWTAITGMTAGLASMLYALQPGGGSPTRASTVAWVSGIGASLAVAGLFVVLGYREQGIPRAAYLGLATGIGFGFIAALVAGIGAIYGASGIGGLLRAPQTYLVIVLGPVFFFLLQKSLQAGRLVASQPALTLANPLVSVAFGFAVFNEHLRAGAWLILALFGAGLIIACTVLLARSPLLHSSGSNESPRTTAASRPVLASNSPLAQKTLRNR